MDVAIARQGIGICNCLSERSRSAAIGFVVE